MCVPEGHCLFLELWASLCDRDVSLLNESFADMHNSTDKVYAFKQVNAKWLVNALIPDLLPVIY